jgi:hypothetical protein
MSLRRLDRINHLLDTDRSNPVSRTDFGNSETRNSIRPRLP